MSGEEMTPNEIKQLRDKFVEQAIDEHQKSVQQSSPSDMFKCGKCLKKNCTYSQFQTRSTDEPMTTYVFCRECVYINRQRITVIVQLIAKQQSAERPSCTVASSNKEMKKMMRDMEKLSMESKSHHGSSSRKKSPPPSPIVRRTSIPSRQFERDEEPDKYVKILFNALDCGGKTAEAEHFAPHAVHGLFEKHNGDQRKFEKSLLRRVFNVKMNPKLRDDVLTGVMSPRRFAAMNSDEMARSEIRHKRDKYWKEGIDEHQMPTAMRKGRHHSEMTPFEKYLWKEHLNISD